MCAAVVGRLVERQLVSEDDDTQRIVLDVVHTYSSRGGTHTDTDTDIDRQKTSNNRGVRVPRVGDIVVCKVIHSTLKNVFVDIIQIEGQDLVETFSGLIRSSDIRSNDIDLLEIHRCFRPRDIVRARVLSLGDQRAYYLTTAEPSLGVVSCLSKTTGLSMVPLDAKTVICKETQETEERKACVV